MTRRDTAPTTPGLPRAPVRIAQEQVESSFAPVLNPARATEVVGEFALGTARHVDLAVSSATLAFADWAALAVHERAELLLRAADRIETGSADRAVLMTREQGKVLWESRLDVGGAPMMLRYYAGLADEIAGLEEMPVPTSRGNALLRHVPVGPVGVISPWNTPVYLAFMAIAPALMAGNPVIVKLPEEVPLALSDALRVLGDVLPPGVLGEVPGLGAEAGEALTSHAGVRRISFTGSIETGKRVMRSAAGNLKNLGMELGGNDPAIVLDDVEITDALLTEFLAGVFSSSGQICYNIKRIYVQQPRYHEFVEAFTEAASRIEVGDGLDSRSNIGPVTTRAGFDRLTVLRDRVAADGAKVNVVGHQLEPDRWDEGYYLLPTVVSDIRDDDALVSAEQFGPIIPILPFVGADEVTARANSTEYGLAASVWSADVPRARDIGRRLEAGSVFVNVHRVGASPMEVPFGGMKQSGVGRNHGMRAVLDSLEEQAVVDFARTSSLPGTDQWADVVARKA